MRVLLTASAVLLALLAQTALSQLAPPEAPLLDLFLLVVVYCGLVGGETHGMLAGVASGWVQDVGFGGPVVGLSGLTKVLVGFAVGMAGARFLVSGPAQRLFLLFGASLLDTLLHEQLAALLEIPAGEASFAAALGRATVTAVVGAGVFEVVDRWRRQEARA